MHTRYGYSQINATESPKFDGYEFRVVMLGDASVGKTALVARFINGSFDATYRQTLNVSLLNKDIQIVDHSGVNHPVRLNIWDMGGHATFRELRRQYMKNASGAILVYDVTRPETFMTANNWFSTFRDMCPDASILICANKIDLVEQRLVLTQSGHMLRDWFQADYFEVSAKTGMGINDVFIRLAEVMLNKVLSQERTT